ncbi:hypothetical protein N9L28_05675 [Luminiphilus sp.]|nr:hypothetical protein [Luminiphilus sp.]
MSAEFRSLVELALSAPIVNPKLIMSCVDEDRELGDLHGWSSDVDSMVKAFESQGDCLLGLRSEVSSDNLTDYISWGSFLCIDEGVPEELVVDLTSNSVMTKIHNAWMESVS